MKSTIDIPLYAVTYYELHVCRCRKTISIQSKVRSPRYCYFVIFPCKYYYNNEISKTSSQNLVVEMEASMQVQQVRLLFSPEAMFSV